MFEGSFVALVTPFKDDESVDETKLRELIETQNRRRHTRDCSLWDDGRVTRPFARRGITV